MKNSLFEVDRSEKKRILEMHTKASKLNYLFESGNLMDLTVQDIIEMILTCYNLSALNYKLADFIPNLTDDERKKFTDFADLDSEIITTGRENGFPQQFNVPGQETMNGFWKNRLDILTNPDLTDEEKSTRVNMEDMKTLYSKISDLIMGYGFNDFPSLQTAVDEFISTVSLN